MKPAEGLQVADVWGSPADPVEVVDALKALRIAVGAEAGSSAKLRFGDVAPLVGNVPQPDNSITAADALVILRKSIGLVAW